MWARFKDWFKNQSTGRQYAVVFGIGFVVLVLVGAASGGDKKQGGSDSSSSGDSVTATQASKPLSPEGSKPSSSELVAQAHRAVKHDSYAQALHARRRPEHGEAQSLAPDDQPTPCVPRPVSCTPRRPRKGSAIVAEAGATVPSGS